MRYEKPNYMNQYKYPKRLYPKRDIFTFVMCLL